MREEQNKQAGKERTEKSRRCPICAKPEAAEFRPFCSRRCAQVDLNRWLSGVYRVPTAAPAAEELPAPAGEAEEPEK